MFYSCPESNKENEMIEEIQLKKTDESITFGVTNEDGQFVGEFVCRKDDVVGTYDGPEGDWLIQGFYWLMSDVTDFCGGSFLNQEEEECFVEVLGKNDVINIMVHWTKPSSMTGPFLCGLEVQVPDVDLKDKLLRFFWDELK